MRVIGFAGWSGAGKTTLIVKLVPLLRERGLTVSTLKHAHHNFDVDKPGKDSWLHREAGATEVLVSSANRFVLMHELRGAPEPRLADLLRMLGPVDLVLVEGFKTDPHVKIEVHRAANGKPFLHPDDETIVALASDLAEGALPHASLDDVERIADLIDAHARPIDETIATLETAYASFDSEKD
ncbi:molybdopterin-guanine dinucleotide biosynthesis protein B [Methylosinus sp. C49]|uniref:molybdopterin-guanine dinucleotide biosynthesis protein B n=1 Tax=Methylosinus sp. C49 TaxID=2699395 RepID=UPI0013678E74|nr:molybdopterin-guanine dinucleotide biosynthesis protein B [Methylosinus sp. C49]BBU62128.1 molybdopterin-guanine dinucleotide biosynthesis protein B [Methylosinus sp. C49]